MPFKSQAQKRKFESLVKQGKMSKQTLDEWNKDTPHKLPERIGPERKNTRPIEDNKYKRRFGK